MAAHRSLKMPIKSYLQAFLFQMPMLTSDLSLQHLHQHIPMRLNIYNLILIPLYLTINPPL